MTAPVYVQLSGTFTSPSGVPASGRVGWHASNFAVQTGSGLVICPVGSSVGLDSTGSFSIPLLATDVNGVAFFYTLVIELAYTWLQGSPTPPAGSGVWSFFLPAANGLEQNFSDLAFLSLPSPLSPGGAPPVFNVGLQPPAGDISGTSIAPTVTGIEGLPITGSPTAGQTLTANNPATSLGWVTQAGGVTLDTTSSDIQPLGTSAAAGSKGQAADSEHIHPNTGMATSAALTTETSRAETAEAGKLSTSGTAAAANAITSATSVVNTSAATAPSNGQVLTAISSSSAAWEAPSGGLAAGQVQSAWAAGIR